MGKRLKKIGAILMIFTMVVVLFPKTAKAASKMAMSEKSKVLYLNEDNMTNTSYVYDFSIKNKPSNYKTKYSFTWYVKDTSIVSIAKGGVVTARSVGTTEVICDIKKKSNGKLCSSVSASVTVKANAATVEINNAPENDQMTVGSTFDFNRTMKAVDGRKATDLTEWVTSDTTIATVDSKGVVTALKPGTFTIQAKCYQSSATKIEGYTCESKPKTIEVKNTIKSFEPIATNEVKITFAAPISKDKNASDFVLTTTHSGTRMFCKSLSYSEDGLECFLLLYISLTSGASYKVAFDDMTKTLDFVKGEAASIEFEDQYFLVDKPSEVQFKVFDANGLDLTPEVKDSCNLFLNRASLPTDSFSVTLRKNEEVYAKIAYVNEETQKRIESREAKLQSKDIAAKAITATTIADSSKSGAVDFSMSNMEITIGDNSKTLFVQVESLNGEKNQIADDFVNYESVTPEIIEITKEGVLKPIQAGTCYIRITVTNNISTLVTVAVKDKSIPSSLQVTSRPGSMTKTDTHDFNNPSVNIQIIDQFGVDFVFSKESLKFEFLAGEKCIEMLDNGILEGKQISPAEFSFQPTTKGTAVIKITYSCPESSKVLSCNTNVSVSDVDNVESQLVIMGLKKLDISKAKGKTETGEDSTVISLYYANAAGFILDKMKCDGDTVFMELSNKDGELIPLIDPSGKQLLDKESGEYRLVSDFVKKLEAGDYKVSFKTKEGETLSVGLLNVVESVTDKLSIKVSANPSNAGTVSGQGVYTSDRAVISAKAEAGYHFEGWYLNGKKQDLKATFYKDLSEEKEDTLSYEARFQKITIVREEKEFQYTIEERESLDNSKKSFVMENTYEAPEEYRFVEAGILYKVKGDLLTEEEISYFTEDQADSVTLIKETSKIKETDGTFQLYLKVSKLPQNKYLFSRGYFMYENEATGEFVIEYSPLVQEKVN